MWRLDEKAGKRRCAETSWEGVTIIQAQANGYRDYGLPKEMWRSRQMKAGSGGKEHFQVKRGTSPSEAVILAVKYAIYQYFYLVLYRKFGSS